MIALNYCFKLKGHAKENTFNPPTSGVINYEAFEGCVFACRDEVRANRALVWFDGSVCEASIGLYVKGWMQAMLHM